MGIVLAAVVVFLLIIGVVSVGIVLKGLKWLDELYQLEEWGDRRESRTQTGKKKKEILWMNFEPEYMQIKMNDLEGVCRTGKYTPKQARGLALSKEVEKYYQNEESQNVENKSTYTPVGECI